LRRSNLANHEAFFGSNLVLEETIEGRRTTTIDDKLARFGFSINKERRECSAPPEVAAGNLQNVFREILMQLAVTSPERPRISRCAPSRVARSSFGEKIDVCENNNCVACPCQRHIERSGYDRFRGAADKGGRQGGYRCAQGEVFWRRFQGAK
jgi:hypothetical protein